MDKWGALEWSLVGAQIVVPQVLNVVIGGRMDKETDRGIDKVVPPGWAFGVVWPLLYIALGFALGFAVDGNEHLWLTLLFYGFLDIWLVAWIPVFNKVDDKKYSLWVMNLIILGVLLVYAYGPRESSLLVAPLLAWLLFASKLNMAIAQHEGGPSYKKVSQTSCRF